MIRRIPPVTKAIIIACVLLYLLTMLLHSSGIDLEVILGGFFPGSPNFHFYQIITSMFMHGGFWHIAINMFVFWSFGAVLEMNLGTKRFTIFYFVCGIGAFLLFNVVNYFEVRSLFNSLLAQGTDLRTLYHVSKLNTSGGFVTDPNSVNLVGNMTQIKDLFQHLVTPMVGASGAVFGVLVGFAVLYPDAKIMLLIPPIPIKAKYMVIGYLALELFLGSEDFAGDNVAHFAHLGGALVGYFLIKYWKNHRYRLR